MKELIEGQVTEKVKEVLGIALVPEIMKKVRKIPRHLQDYDITHINTAQTNQATQPITDIGRLFLDRE